VGLSDEKVKQCAQILVYEFAQQAVARGGQVIFSDLNLYWGIPKHYLDVEAIGPGGVSMGVPYKEFDYEAKRFMKALMQVYAEGDGAGRPFFFPKADCHITAETVDDEEYMNMLGNVASKMGSPYFVFDRGNDTSVSQCCRLKLKLTKDDVSELATPWKSRFTALQNVTMNLPAFAYMAGGNETKFDEILYENMMLAKDAHKQKLDFINGILALGPDGPLNLLLMNHDGSPYFRHDKTKFLVGMVGLNEAVQLVCGQQLHESTEAMKVGMKMIAQMNNNCKDITKELGLTTILEQTPAESTAYRFARLDAKRFGEPINKVFKGTSDSPYYTNSTYMNVGANIDPIERVKKEGKFHPLIDAGAITHVWLGNHAPPAESIAQFVRKTFYNTQNAQIAFSPEFTTCNACQKTTMGANNNCVYCGSLDVDLITRVTGYYSKVSSWNKGKRQEYIDRARVSF
jgi:ribonucleoside-triphosphate reductase (formate)